MKKWLFGLPLIWLSPALGAVSEPYASGQSGQLNWELRVNHLTSDSEGMGPSFVCDHSDNDKKPGAWCESQDTGKARSVNGVEDRIEEIVRKPEIKSVTLAYFSFSSTPVARALCEASLTKKVRVYIQWNSLEGLRSLFEKAEAGCSKRVETVGVGFGEDFSQKNYHLFHMKILIASELPALLPLSALESSLSDEDFKKVKKAKTYVVSSSGNMSSYGTTLHFDNWLFFSGPQEDNIIQNNICALTSLEGVGIDKPQDLPKDQRKLFAQNYKSCRERIAAKERPDIRFFAVPHAKMNPEPYKAYVSIVESAKKSLRVAIHRMTSKSIWLPWLEAKDRGVDVKVVCDDDTLRYGKVDGGPAHDMKSMDVIADRVLRKAKVGMFYMETNADSIKHLFHNKFMIADGKRLFQGAGNFSAAALNITGLGNYEQFYEISDPGIVGAYSQAWDDFASLATKFKDHESAGLPDRPLNEL